MNEYAKYKPYQEYTPSEFIDLIDRKFEESIGRIKRIDIEWGTWSREMNLVVKDKINEDGEDKVELGLVFAYWTVVSQLLDLVYNYKGLRRFILEKKVKNKAEEAKMLREKVCG